MNTTSSDTPRIPRKWRWVLWVLTEALLLIPIVIILIYFGRMIDQKQQEEESSSVYIEGGTTDGLYTFDARDGVDTFGV